MIVSRKLYRNLALALVRTGASKRTIEAVATIMREDPKFDVHKWYAYIETLQE